MVAGLAVLDELERNPPYEYIEAMGHVIREGIGAALGLSGSGDGGGGLFHIHSSDQPINNKRAAMRADHARQYEFSMGLISKRIPFTPAHPGFLSAAHSAEDAREVIRVAAEAPREMAGK